MRIIKALAEQIKDELHDAKKYAKDAMQYKYEHPQLASTYNELSAQELEHAMKLHSFVVKFIDEQRAKETPPPYMLEMWKDEHDLIMEKAAKIKHMQGMFRA